MSNYNLYVAFSIIVVVVGAIAIVFPILKKKGINSVTILSEIKTGLEDVQTALTVGKQLDPNNKIITVLDLLDKAALSGTSYASQMAISAQLPLEQRKQAATDSIINELEVFKIPVTPEMKILINTTIEKTIFDSKTPGQVEIQGQNTLSQQNATLQATIAQLNADKTSLEQQAIILNSKINAVQGAVTATTIKENISSTADTQVTVQAVIK